MNLFIPLLMLLGPGIISLYVHNKKFVLSSKDNRVDIILIYMMYSFLIMLVTNAIIFLLSPGYIYALDVLSVSFVLRYSLLSIAIALVLPWFWGKRHALLKFWRKSKTFKIGKDE